MTSAVSLLQDLAASGTQTLTLAFPNPAQGLQVQLAAHYTAVAATSGVTASFQISRDGGSTFGASNVATIKAAPAAGATAAALAQFYDVQLGGQLAVDAGNITHVKVSLTNTDATNGCAVAVLSETIH